MDNTHHNLLTIALVNLLTYPVANANLIADSQLTLKLRNFYYNNDVRNDYQPTAKTEEWGQGVTLDFKSGYTDTTLAVGVDILAMSAFKLDSGGSATKADRTRNPGTIFPLQHNNRAVNSFGSLGVTAKFKYANSVLQHGMLQPTLPVIVYNDGRLLPQTFYGTLLTSNAIDRVTLVAGQINKAKGRNASGYSNLSVLGAYSPRNTDGNITYAPAVASNKFLFAGANYQLLPNTTLQYHIAQLKDFYKQHFFGLTHDIKLADAVIETDIRYFDSRSQGKNSHLRGRQAGYTIGGWYNKNNPTGKILGEVDNKLLGGSITYRKNAYYLGVGYQQLTGKSDFPWLDQGNGTTRYTFTPGLVANYSRAGERTYLLKAGYDFTNIGLIGLKLDVAYYKGNNIQWLAGGKTEWERNFILSYTIPHGTLKNVSIRWLNGFYRTSLAGVRDQDENRLSIDYSIPIF